MRKQVSVAVKSQVIAFEVDSSLAEQVPSCGGAFFNFDKH